ncbi:MAG: polyamine aminopropyltransferase [Elainellaceae cyanobacterium]
MEQSLTRKQLRWLLAAAAVSSGCGLAAELLLGTLASYLVGNQALAYGVAVGGFLAAMGLGAYLTRFVAPDGEDFQVLLPTAFKPPPDIQSLLLTRFFQIELLIALLTALLPLGLFALFTVDGPLWLGLGLVTLLLGTLAGAEVPLLTRLVERDRGMREALAGVLALDYVGGLAGSLLFPVVLLPLLGMFPAAAVIGAFPAWMVYLMGYAFPGRRGWRRAGLALGLGLLLFAPLTLPVSNRLENRLYGAPVVSRQQSAYQRIVLTRYGQDVRLFLDGDLQMSTLDEHRYHEALIHPALAASGTPRSVLLMGAGDGMALREVLKWPEVEQVLIIELDPQVIALAHGYPALAEANGEAFDDSRVTVRYGDAFRLVPDLKQQFDVIVADFPDPDVDAIAKLYSLGFYRQLRQRLTPSGVLVTQASSPFFAPKAFACIKATLEAAGFSTYPYTASVPSFGPWGFVLAGSGVDPAALTLPVPTRFLTESLLPALFVLPKDVGQEAVQINRLGHPVIVRYQNDARWALYN